MKDFIVTSLVLSTTCFYVVGLEPAIPACQPCWVVWVLF